MTKKYHQTELDTLLEQFKGTSEWTNEKQLEWELNRKEESHKKELERKSLENVELYTDNVLLKRQIRSLQSELDELKSKYWCKGTDENGNKIPMTKVKGSRVMSKEEVKKLNKVKLPF
jgi:hypothetical protein